MVLSDEKRAKEHLEVSVSCFFIAGLIVSQFRAIIDNTTKGLFIVH